MNDEQRLSPCPGCGESLLEIDGARHPYVGASSACWTRFAEINSALPPATPLRRLVTDAFMVQHPGVPERRAIQSVGLHLVALCLVLEHDLPPVRLSGTVKRILEQPPMWRWLDPPVPNGELTIGDVAAAVARGSAGPGIETYVRGIWNAWSDHHSTVEGWVRDVSRG